ncbi:MAG: hypothetical protein ACK5NF_04125 [Bacilli bacterium]
MEVKELLTNYYISKSDGIYPSYDMGSVKSISLREGEVIKVDKIVYDEMDKMVIVMCKVSKLYVNFVVSLQQLKTNFKIKNQILI